MRRDEAFLLDIVIHARFLAEMCSRTTSQDFFSDKQRQLSAQKALEIIGEASRKISADYKRSHAGVPWQDWIELRNAFVHQYFRIDTAELWEAVQQTHKDALEYIEPLVPPPADSHDQL